MKKNVMMRLASFLLVAVLISSSAISGTYAKYVTYGEGFDEARVAKFGVTVTANGNMFAEAYVLGDTVAATGSETTSVQSDDGKDVVAPGTSGTMATMTLTGTPEVDVRVTYDATVEINDKWVIGTGKYFPLVIEVDGTPVVYAQDADVSVIEQAIEDAIEDNTKDYKAGTPLSGVGADAVKVAWSWPFEIDDATNKKDTDLGDAAAAGNAGTIKITIKTTVSQIN